jgi:hydroxypyruvate isomerase
MDQQSRSSADRARTSSSVDRRQLLQGAAGSMVGAMSLLGASHAQQPSPAAGREGSPRVERVIKNGRIRQSLVSWCYTPYWEPEELIQLAKQLGCGSVELISPRYFAQLKEAGMECAIASVDIEPGPPFARGFNNPRYHDQVLEATRKAIDACAEFGFQRVIAFTGMREELTDEEGADNCVAAFKKIVPYAEERKVTLCLEMLNTRDDSHPMKGHPGYQGDNTEYCVDIIRRVGSPNLKLLFDIYHVQIMDGDVIRRIRQHQQYIGHIHTAGNPGRGELDQTQEINYPAVMQALLDVGYQGFVGQEFIPTRDPLEGLKEAIAVCDV